VGADAENAVLGSPAAAIELTTVRFPLQRHGRTIDL
jgi:hypothetical protein